MLAIHRKSWAALAVAATLATPAVAELSAADIGKLGTTLTPLGGEKAGNAARTIPEWTGGQTRVEPLLRRSGGGERLSPQMPASLAHPIQRHGPFPVKPRSGPVAPRERHAPA